MRRVISVFLPTWPTDRLRRRCRAALSPDSPLVTTIQDGRRKIVAGADRAALGLGLFRGMALAQAQALVPDLTIVSAEPEADREALDRLAGWCLRFAPLTSSDPPDGIWIDATGAGHLFGGEPLMLTTLVERLARGGFAARAAIADTPGAAWAMARHGEAPLTVVPAGEAEAALRPLPLTALRLPDDTIEVLGRLGFARIGELLDAPREPLARRFDPDLLRRIDQALGRRFEPIEPVPAPETISARLAFPEPLLTSDALAAAMGRLCRMICRSLERRGLGARRLDLGFERVDYRGQTICIGTVRPTREPEHLAKLLLAQLERVDPGLGVEAMHLAAPLTEQLSYTQPATGLIDAKATTPDISPLIDRLVNRLGAERVYRVVPVESDVPERSLRRAEPMAPPSRKRWPQDLPRPARLLRPPQPIEALSQLPDHPPAQFIWRRKRYRVRRADGPERIAGEWWKADAERSAIRDYWQVEDQEGCRFWLYRSGDAVDPATGDLRWFLHGFF
jgi:protein ImuB